MNLNLTIEEFDNVYMAVDYNTIQEYQPKQSINLMECQFGTILECLKISQPSKVVELITKELCISVPNNELIPLWKYLNEQLKELSELLATTNAHTKQDSFNNAIWQNLLQDNPLDPYMFVIDELSEKWHLPYADVLKQPFGDCFVALRIIKIRKEFEDKVLRHNQTKK